MPIDAGHRCWYLALAVVALAGHSADAEEVPLFRFHHYYTPKALFFLPDSPVLVTVCGDDTVCFWDTKTGRPDGIARGAEPRHEILDAALLGDGRELAYHQGDRCVHIVNVATRQLARTLWLRRKQYLRYMACSPDGKTIALASRVYVDDQGREQRNGWITLISAATGREIHSYPPDGGIPRTFCSNGASIIEGDAIREVATGKVRGWIHVDNVRDAFFTPDGDTVVTRESGNAFEASELVTRRRRFWQWHTPGHEISRICKGGFSPDGWLFATSGEFPDRGGIFIADTDSGEALWTTRIPEVRKVPLRTAISPDHTRLAVAYYDGDVDIWAIDPAKFPARKALESPRTTRTLEEKTFDAMWADLLRMDDLGVRLAYRHMRVLTDCPRATVAFLRKQLPPAATDRNQLARWIDDLDADAPASREKAMGELRQRLPVAAAMIQDRVDRNSFSLEGQRRGERLLDEADIRTLTPQEVRSRRAVEVLFAIDTADARTLLNDLAQGAPGAHLTEDARRASTTLARRLRACSR